MSVAAEGVAAIEAGARAEKRRLSVGAADNLHIGGVDNFVVIVGASAAGVRIGRQ